MVLLLCLYESLPCTAWRIRIVFDETKDNYINYWNLGTWGIIPTLKKIGATTAITLQQVSMPDYVKRHDLHELHSYWLLAHFSYQEVILIM